MRAIHLTARLRQDRVDLRAPGLAEPLWSGLRRAFPDVLAAELMDNHLHVLPRGVS